jgi:hypothetical protein
MTEWRNRAIEQAQEQRLVADVKIAQKVGAAHRDAFKLKFPGQVEHCMRLIAERLQLGLRKDQDVELPSSDIRNLAEALSAVYSIHCQLDKAE